MDPESSSAINNKFTRVDYSSPYPRIRMQKILSNGVSVSSLSHRRIMGQSLRAFASSPQPNPFDKSIKTSLEHAGSKHNFYKLPALADSRICKWYPFPSDHSFSVPALLNPRAPRECRPQLRRLQCQGGWHRKDPRLGQKLWTGRRDSFPPSQSHPLGLHVRINYNIALY